MKQRKNFWVGVISYKVGVSIIENLNWLIAVIDFRIWLNYRLDSIIMNVNRSLEDQ